MGTQVAALRHLLFHNDTGTGKDSALGAWVAKVRQGEVPLVVEAESADVIATLVELKKEVEHKLGLGKKLKVTIAGGHEAHLLARELGAAGMGVLLTEPRPFPKQWEARRM